MADGYDVGNRLELMLLDGDVASAKRFSDEVHRAVAESAALATSTGADLIFLGGDGFLVVARALPSSSTICNEMQARFKQICGCTLSIGTGPDAPSATNALRRAKLLGKNRIISLGVANAT